MPKPIEWLKAEGELYSDIFYKKIMEKEEYNNLSYTDFVLLLDFMYAGLFERIYKETYGKGKNPTEVFDKK